MILTLITVGKFMEARAKGQTGDAIRKLLGLRAKTARIVRGTVRPPKRSRSRSKTCS